jgi:lysophospholipase L1-like esterase
MIYKTCEFHNINEVEYLDGRHILHRFPKHVRDRLESKHNVSIDNSASEIRFILQGKVHIRLSPGTAGTEWRFARKSGVMVYYGDFQYNYYLVPQEGITLELKPVFSQETLQCLDVAPHHFSPHLVRLQLFNSISLDEISGEYTLPKPEDIPSKRYLAYGTSITQNRLSLLPDITYPGIFADLIGYDVYNYGMGGACFIEDAIIDFLVEQTYDLITLCVSVNMLNQGYSAEIFAQRLNKLLELLTQKNPHAPVFLISIATHWRDIGIVSKPFEWDEPETPKNLTKTGDYREFRNIAEQAAQKFRCHFVDGRQILSPRHLTVDLLHPANHGAIEMAYKLYEKYRSKPRCFFVE